MHFFSKLKHILWIVVGLFSLFFVFSWTTTYKPSELEYGLTFSGKQARDLGFDSKTLYTAMLDELQVKKLRLPAYWDELEKNQGEYDWSELDWQIDEAEKRNVELIIAMGQRVPRWPECHIPQWALEQSEEQRQAATLEYINKTISRYKDRAAIAYWQIENEPFLKHFGICPDFKKDFLDKEIALARELDTRPIIVTDSGELSLWIPAAKRADIFGTTLYLSTYSRIMQSYIRYPITPVFFRIKKNITNLFSNPQEWIVIELQGEPWGKKAFYELNVQERERTMSEDKFNEMLEFIPQTGFKTFYWWGVEYWYWEKETQHNPFYWDKAKQLFN